MTIRNRQKNERIFCGRTIFAVGSTDKSHGLATSPACFSEITIPNSAKLAGITQNRGFYESMTVCQQGNARFLTVVLQT
jgi:hypothetical protein